MKRYRLHPVQLLIGLLLLAGLADVALDGLRLSPERLELHGLTVERDGRYVERLGWLAYLAPGLHLASELLFIILGFLLLSRPGLRPDIGLLALFCALFVLPVEALGPERAERAAPVVLFGALGCFLRFSTLFPRPLGTYHIDAARASEARGESGDGLAGRVAATRRLRGGVAGTRRLTPVEAGEAGGPWAVLDRRLLEPLVVWGSCAVAAASLAAFVALDGGVRSPAALLLVVPAVVLVLVSYQSLRYLRIGYQVGGRDDRRRMLWIVQGISAALWIGALVVGGLLLSRLMGLSPLVVREVSLVAGGVATLIIPLSFGAATFFHGALDPSLVLRKSTVYGVLGLAVTGLFVLLEGALSSQLVVGLGFPSEAVAIVTGGAIALALAPLRNRVEHRVNAVVDHLLPPSALAEGKRKQAFVVFSDIVGYTRLMARDERMGLTVASLFHTTAGTLAAQWQGRLVKTIGDAVLLEFDDADHAITAALELRRRFLDAARALGLPDLETQTGIHFGQIVVGRDGDVFGDVVNVASRLEGLASASEVVVSRDVARGVTSREIELVSLGPQELKNVPRPLECFRVEGAGGGPKRKAEESSAPQTPIAKTRRLHS